MVVALIINAYPNTSHGRELYNEFKEMIIESFGSLLYFRTDIIERR